MSFHVKRVTDWDELWQTFEECPFAYPVAGGTDIIPRVNQGIEKHEQFVCLEGLPDMRGVSFEADGSVRIGALTKLVEISENEALAQYGGLREACSRVASPQIRNQATIGGNVLQENRCVYFNQSVSWRRVDHCFKLGGDRCYQYPKALGCMALFQSDVAPALISYNAITEWKSPRGTRTALLSELYKAAGRKAKEPDEILTGLVIPPVTGALHSAYVRKTIRASIDFPLVSCAVSLGVEDQVIKTAKIVVGSAGVMPRNVNEAPVLLEGKTLKEAAGMCKELQDAVTKKIAPFQDSRVDGPTRQALGRDALKRALAQACEEV